MATSSAEKFPRVFWTANVTELFERAAYYSMASFVVIYLGQLGFGAYWPSNLNSVLWTLVYFLPILSGTIADQVGFRRSLLVAFVLLAAGYFLMGVPVWFAGGELAPIVAKEFTAKPGLVGIVVVAILLIGMGGSVIKPCISGTVQKTSGTLATLGFAIFYMVINIGSLFGRGTAYVVRTRSSVVPVLLVVLVCALAAAALILLARWSAAHRERRGNIAATTVGSLSVLAVAVLLISWVLWLPGGQPSGGSGSSLSYIFAVAAVASIAAFFVVLFFYQEPAPNAGTPAKPKRSVGRILLDMVLVLKSGRFTLFLLVISGFFFLYNQVYNVLPLYVKRVVELTPAMDLYTAANPLVIVCFQLLITSRFGRMRPIRSMIIGSIGISLSMAVNLFPVFAAGGVRALVANWLPIGSVFVIMTVALIAFAELFTSPRMFEYIGALAPKGQEGLFLGYANLPLAIGSLFGGPVGAFIFNDIMAKGATKRPDGLLDLDPTQNALGWMILMAIGLASAFSMWLFNRWLEKQKP
ncbi:MAG: MFS transporter [Thermoanaerobaculaceae bacterium]|nr:MFS transporter [Thermoanaerobaculaceae bacterium]